MRVLSLFDGISCGRVALERAGIKVNKYFSSEINEHAIKITQKNYPDTIQLGDIRDVVMDKFTDIDLLIGGSPCQGFSFAGKQLNFNDDRSKLFFEFVRILKQTKPKYFLLENVKMKQEFQDIISEQLGVKPIEINSSDFIGASRKRLYWTNIPIKEWEIKNIVIKDILEDNVEDIYYLTKSQKEKLDLNFNWRKNKAITHKGGKHQQDLIYHFNGKMGCLSASTHGAGRHLTKTFLPNGEVRRLTEIECERLQTLPDNYTSGISSSARYEAIGNCWTVDVISHIFKEITTQFHGKVTK